MSIFDLWNKWNLDSLAGEAAVGLFIILSLIQISPVKINPWDKILGWFGKKINQETEKTMEDLKKQVSDLWINNHRQGILTFARECRSGITHDSEEWSNVLNLCEEYEHYTESNHVTNGVVKENTKYIRDLYQKKSHANRLSS